MALPTLLGSDGRRAVLAFTCLPSLTGWRPDARPVPVTARQVWQAGAQEASAVVIDIAGPVPFAVDGARLAALAEGRPAPLPHDDPDVRALAAAALAGEPLIAGFALLPGGGDSDLTISVTLARGYGPADARARGGDPAGRGTHHGRRRRPGAARDHGGRQHGRPARGHPPGRRPVKPPARPVEPPARPVEPPAWPGRRPPVPVIHRAPVGGSAPCCAG